MTEPFSTTEPDAIRQPSPIIAPSMCALWPIVQPAPMSVGFAWLQCTIVPSWTLVRAPISIRLLSPRSTAVGQIDAPAPRVTLPISTASGWT
jgi:hypothetical protein